MENKSVPFICIVFKPSNERVYRPLCNGMINFSAFLFLVQNQLSAAPEFSALGLATPMHVFHQATVIRTFRKVCLPLCNRFQARTKIRRRPLLFVHYRYQQA